MPRHGRLVLLRLACLGFAALGLLLPWAFHTVVFAPYRDALVAAIGPVDAGVTLVLGMTGGSIAGKWIAHLALLEVLARTRERWAWRASVAGLVVWFVVDSATSLAHGAWWNVVMINVVPVVVVGPGLAAGRRHADIEAPPPVSLPPVRRWAWIAMLLGVASGLVIAGFGLGAPFAPWRDSLGAALGDAGATARATALLGTFLGPIGGSTAAQFVMLAALIRHRADGRAVGWCVASITTWFVIDSAWSLVAGAAFNVAMVNLPFAALTIAPLLLAARAIAAPATGSTRTSAG